MRFISYKYTNLICMKYQSLNAFCLCIDLKFIRHPKSIGSGFGEGISDGMLSGF